MENKINVSELLKYCPSGMELNCLLWDNVTFERVADDGIWIKHIDSESGERSLYVYNDGSFPIHNLGSFRTKCVIFPKGKTTWEGFVPPYKFKDGDVCYVKTGSFEYIFIFKYSENYDFILKYANLSENILYINKSPLCTTDSVKEIRFATEKEKAKLFQAIKNNGYEWNAKTKILTQHKEFKDGDILATNDGKFIAIVKKNGGKYYCCCHINGDYFVTDYSGWFDRLATKEEKQILFDAIKERGYRWNARTKTLETLFPIK